MVRRFYGCASAWVQEDPKIAKAMVRDIAEYVSTTGARQGLPECIYLVSSASRTGKTYRVDANWRDYTGVVEYLAKNGFDLEIP